MEKTYYKKEIRVWESEEAKEDFAAGIKGTWLALWGIWTFILFIQSTATHAYYLNPDGWNNPAIFFWAIPILLGIGIAITILFYFINTKTKYSKWTTQ